MSVAAGGDLHLSPGGLECSGLERSCYFPSQQHCKHFLALSSRQLLETGNLQRPASVKCFIFFTAEAKSGSWGLATNSQLAGGVAAWLFFGGLQHWGMPLTLLLPSAGRVNAFKMPKTMTCSFLAPQVRCGCSDNRTSKFCGSSQTLIDLPNNIFECQSHRGRKATFVLWCRKNFSRSFCQGWASPKSSQIQRNDKLTVLTIGEQRWMSILDYLQWSSV